MGGVISIRVATLWLIGLAVSLAASPAAAQVENLLDCPLHPGQSGSNCRICNRGGVHDEDCARAKSVLRSHPLSPWRHDSKGVSNMSCGAAMTFARTYGFKTTDDMRREAEDARRRAKEAADAATARSVEVETERLRRHHDDVRRQARDNPGLGGTRDAWEADAEQMERQARALDDKASAALRAGDYKQSRAYSDAARESRAQAFTGRQFASDAERARRDAADRATQQARDAAAAERMRANLRDNLRQNAPGVLADAAFEGARDELEERGIRTRVPGEAVVRRGQDYVDEAQRRVDDNGSNWLGRRGADVVRQNGSRINELLDRPLDSTGGRAASPPASGGSATSYLPPAIPAVRPAVPATPPRTVRVEEPSPPNPQELLRRQAEEERAQRLATAERDRAATATRRRTDVLDRVLGGIRVPPPAPDPTPSPAPRFRDLLDAKTAPPSRFNDLIDDRKPAHGFDDLLDQ